MTRVITFGTFDRFHIRHLNILERASKMGTNLTVGISTDALNYKKKSRYPVYTEESRASMVEALSCVDEVFFEESLALKREYIESFKADILVMGDGWQEKFDDLNDICQVSYLPRTPSISTTGAYRDC